MTNPYQQPDNQPYGQQPYVGPQSTPYQQPPAAPADGRFDSVQSITYAFKAFGATWGTWILAQLLFLAMVFAALIVMLIPGGVAAAIADSSSGSSGLVATSSIIMAVIIIAFIVVISVIFQLNFVRNAVRVVQGEKVTIRDFWRIDGLGIPFLVGLVVGLLAVAGMLVLVGSIVVAVIFQFALVAAFALRQAGVGAVLGSAWDVFKNNIGQAILLFILCYLISLAGNVIVIGILVAAPVMYLAQAHAYLTAVRGPVVPRP